MSQDHPHIFPHCLANRTGESPGWGSKSHRSYQGANVLWMAVELQFSGSLFSDGEASVVYRTVGGLEHTGILGIIIPTDELIFLRGVGQPPTSCMCFLI